MTVILSNIGLHCDHIDKKLRDQLAQQFLRHHIHLKHQMTSNKQPRLEVHSITFFQDNRHFCATNSCCRKTTFVSLRCEASSWIENSCSRQMCWFLASLMQCHKTVISTSHRLRMTMRRGSTPAIARNLEIEWTSTLRQNHLQAVVPRPPVHPEV